MRRLAHIIPVAMLGWIVAVPSAQAQIYAWRTPQGTLVLSDRPAAPSVATFAVPQADAIRTTRRVAPTGRNRYDRLIDEHAARHRVRPELVRAVIQVESAYDPKARSPRGAMGLMQLMPGTAAELQVNDPFDPSENIRGGVAYLRQLLTRYEEDETLALAAYNAGPGAVDRHGQQIPPYAETRDYVQRVRTVTSLGASVGARPGSLIYRSYDTVNGRTVPRLSNVPPQGTSYEIVDGR
jgi:soluble lytic murein transglycosylase-like protein